MRQSKHILSGVFLTLGLVILGLAAFLAFTGRNAPVRLLTVPQKAQSRTEELMQALSEGNWSGASAFLYGSPALEDNPTLDTLVAEELYTAYRTGLQYSFLGDCEADGTGLSRSVQVTVPDIPAILEELEPRFRQTLSQRAEAEKETRPVYDDGGNYQEAYLMSVLADTARELLAEENLPTRTQTLKLNLVCRDGQWYVLPDQALMNLLSGSMTR